MSNPVPHTPARGPLVFLGLLAAFASFAVIAAVLQVFAGGKVVDPQSAVRLKNKEEIDKAQQELMKKSGLAGNADAVISKAVEQIGLRKLEASKVVVPGSPTAIKQSAPVPATALPEKPAVEPALAPDPAPVAPIEPPPAAAPPPSIDVPAPSAPAPEPAPAPAPEPAPAPAPEPAPAPAPEPAPAPAPPVPGTN